MPSQDTWSSIAGSYTGSYYSRRRTWVRTPGFRSLAPDSLPVNNYDDKRTFYTQVSREASYRVDNGVKTVVSGPGYLFNGTSIESTATSFHASRSSEWSAKIAALENDAIVRLYGKVAARKVDIGVMYAEATKTSNLILDTANRIDRAYRAFRRGQFQRVAQILNINPKRVHKTWLEYKYGWMPLLQDVESSAEFFAQQAVGRPERFSVKVNATANGPVSPYVGNATNLPWANRVWSETGSYDWKMTRKMWLEITNPTASQMQQLGLTNPLLIAWELVPFSFVFDWFIHVGKYLEGITAFHGITVRRYMRSNHTMLEYNYDQGASTRTVNSLYYYYNAAFNFTGPIKYYARTPATVDLTAIYPPGRRGISSIAKLLTSLALLRGQYRGSNARI